MAGEPWKSEDGKIERKMANHGSRVGRVPRHDGEGQGKRRQANDRACREQREREKGEGARDAQTKGQRHGRE